jgi:pyrimidine-nucleoside phosphorylase
MAAPLGYAVGNANEVAEAIAVLEGREGFADCGGMVGLCVELAANMVSLALDMEIEAARSLCRERLADGSAYEKFKAMVAAHGGDLGRFWKMLERPKSKFRIQAMRSGVVSAIDAEKVAKVAFELGAGRQAPGEAIDPLAGVTLAVAIGDRVAVGDALATLEKSSGPDGLEKCAAELYKAFAISASAPERANLVVGRV